MGLKNSLAYGKKTKKNCGGLVIDDEKSQKNLRKISLA